jgi:hypothetical protein
MKSGALCGCAGVCNNPHYAVAPACATTDAWTKTMRSTEKRMSLDKPEELRVRAELLALITQAEAGAKWTDLEELRERAELLGYITKMEAEAKWSSIQELRERAELLVRIAKAEGST